eukprot:6149538-Ditylum_brightwellii.AAC.2
MLLRGTSSLPLNQLCTVIGSFKVMSPKDWYDTNKQLQQYTVTIAVVCGCQHPIINQLLHIVQFMQDHMDLLTEEGHTNRKAHLKVLFCIHLEMFVFFNSIYKDNTTILPHLAHIPAVLKSSQWTAPQFLASLTQLAMLESDTAPGNAHPGSHTTTTPNIPNQ